MQNSVLKYLYLFYFTPISAVFICNNSKRQKVVINCK
nr:MAG TPA: hypothetical protein [Caudoviricetes sp.]